MVTWDTEAAALSQSVEPRVHLPTVTLHKGLLEKNGGTDFAA